MLTLYILTGIAFAACVGWPVVLGLMVWREWRGE